jgi:hypothetical protein
MCESTNKIDLWKVGRLSGFLCVIFFVSLYLFLSKMSHVLSIPRNKTSSIKLLHSSLSKLWTGSRYCSLSPWRVARGSKLMRLELIHGLFITLTEFRLSTTFIPVIIIMHIYKWHHSNVTGIHYVHEHRLQHRWHIPPCFFISPCPPS